MIELSVAAVFDCLYIAEGLQDEYGGATEYETQAISYLACLLSVYRGRPAASWGYEFVASHSTSPFAEALQAAHERLLQAGNLTSALDVSRFQLTDVGRVRQERLLRMRQFDDRRVYLRGALDAAHAMPLPALQSAIRQEPQVALSAALALPQRLLDEVGMTALHRDFQALQQQLGERADLIVPAVVWLSFLLRQDEFRADSAVQP